jgi:hypothetical protein
MFTPARRAYPRQPLVALTSGVAPLLALARVFFASMLLSCGSATALDFDPPTKDAPPAEQGKPKPEPPMKPPPNSGSSGGGAGAQSGVDLPSFELPECKPGARPNTVDECIYMAEGLCYEDVASACACVCPTAQETFCFEGLFLNVWNAVEVWCSKKR